jgi:pimeloyl-ACP methyl ester carboxylesterase
MRKMLCLLTITLLCSMLLGALAPAQASGKPTPPGQAAEGYGSSQGYVSPGYTVLTRGCPWSGKKVTCFVPNRLKNETSAPVVVFLHGFKLVVPDFYLGFIEHLTKQGYIVIFPMSNVGGLFISLFDTDQNVFMQRAIDNTNKGLSLVGRRADLNDVTVFGHSLGALLASCWIGSGGIRPKALVLANVSTDTSQQGVPVEVTPIDWREKAKAVDVPVFLLTGNRDTIAPTAQSIDMYESLVNAPSRVVYSMRRDRHGFPPLAADHNISLTSNWFIPGFLMSWMFGGEGTLDAVDYRFCWAALDAALDNQTEVTFDMGSWSDLTPVKPVQQLAP